MSQISTRGPGIRPNLLAIALGVSLGAVSMASQAAANSVFSIVDALKLGDSGGAMGAMKLDDSGWSKDMDDAGKAGAGYTMNTYHFDLSNLAPAYSATLTDTGLFGTGPIGMALLGPSMKLVGSQTGSGSFGFKASESGIYTLVVAGKPSAPSYFDAYAAQVTAVPEAGRTAMLLTGLGLVGLRLRRRAQRQRPTPV